MAQNKFLRMMQGQPAVVMSNSDEEFGKMSQWTSSDGVRFFPSGQIWNVLPPGVYEIQMTQTKGIMYEKVPVKTEGLVRFPETNSEKVLEEIQSFWEKEAHFKKFDLSYKRGIILYGPPGTGKSCTIQLVMADVIERGGVVFKFNVYPEAFIEGIRQFREIQPKTPLVILIEDIDSIIEMYSESEILQILDGVDNIERVVFVATTNFPENLGSRILNRPSRFDKRFKMPPPKKSSRRIFFDSLLDEQTIKDFSIDIDQWVDDTNDMSIAHLKELFIAVVILGNPYDEAISNLKVMNEERVKVEDDFVGFIKNKA